MAVASRPRCCVQPYAALHIMSLHVLGCNTTAMDCIAMQIGTPAAPLAYGLMMRRGSIVMQLWPPALPLGGLNVIDFASICP
jgi:hypothetical protein